MYDEKTNMPVNDPTEAREGICSMARAIGQLQSETMEVVNTLYGIFYGKCVELPPNNSANCLEQEMCMSLDKAKSILNAVLMLRDGLN